MRTRSARWWPRQRRPATIACSSSDRDLLEAVVFPSVSFARGYEPAVVQTKSGVVHNGVLRVDGPDEIVLSTPASPPNPPQRGACLAPE